MLRFPNPAQMQFAMGLFFPVCMVARELIANADVLRHALI
jgi:hypothetical protein